MRHTTMIFALATILMVFSGCQSRKARMADLQKQYDQLAKQFQQDCSAEYLSVPPKISPKCEEEDKKMKAAWDRLQAERATK